MNELGAYTLRTEDIRARCAAAVARLPVGGDVPVRVVFERVKRTRSTLANAYYWGVVLRSASQAFGYAIARRNYACDRELVDSLYAMAWRAKRERATLAAEARAEGER